MLLRLIRRFSVLNALEDTGGGGAVEPPAASEVAAPVDAPVAPAEPEAPKTMFEAMFQPRDELGRFAPKNADGTPVEPQPAVPAVPVVPVAAKPAVVPEPEEDDPTKMPEGLGPKAQERFQKLATGIRERDTQIEQLSGQVEYIRDTFQQHGVQREQFEQAASVIGLINRGQFTEAAQILQEQLKHLSVLSGQQFGQVDALQDFPDLREAVNGMQITEQHAMELARARRSQELVQQRQQQHQQVQQTQQQEKLAFEQGQSAVDALCKQLAATDLDYPAIEAKLLPQLVPLLEGVPPQHWAKKVKTQYDLIKSVASGARQQTPPQGLQSGTVLRPTGPTSPAAAPRSMHEAMWGNRT